MALPLYVDERTPVSFVLNRGGRDFSDRDRDVCDLAATTLGAMYRGARPPRRPGRLPERLVAALTRERQVAEWLSAGKTDRDIAAILGCSHRTVQKHLQRIYDKLGVETRTAAALRWLGSATH